MDFGKLRKEVEIKHQTVRAILKGKKNGATAREINSRSAHFSNVCVCDCDVFN